MFDIKQLDIGNYTRYQLILDIEQDITILVGALGYCDFPAGRYCYTGSAKKNMLSRLSRHIKKDKILRWHIDYITSHPLCNILDIRLSNIAECEWNQSSNGKIVIAKLGASDCKNNCISHLKKLPP